MCHLLTTSIKHAITFSQYQKFFTVETDTIHLIIESNCTKHRSLHNSANAINAQSSSTIKSRIPEKYFTQDIHLNRATQYNLVKLQLGDRQRYESTHSSVKLAVDSVLSVSISTDTSSRYVLIGVVTHLWLAIASETDAHHDVGCRLEERRVAGRWRLQQRGSHSDGSRAVLVRGTHVCVHAG